MELKQNKNNEFYIETEGIDLQKAYDALGSKIDDLEEEIVDLKKSYNEYSEIGMITEAQETEEELAEKQRLLEIEEDKLIDIEYDLFPGAWG